MARKHIRRYRSTRSSSPERKFKSNPPPLTEIAEFVLPGFAGFAATRFSTYIAVQQINNRWPTMAPHAGAIASIGSAAAAYLFAHKVKFLEKYSMPIVVGSSIAAIQTLVQTYLPKVGWMVGDATAALDTAAAATTASSAQLNTTDVSTQSAPLPPGVTAVDDDPTAYTYDDRYDSGVNRNPSRYYGGQNGGGQQPSSAQPTDDLSDLDISNDDLGSLSQTAGN